MGTRAQPWVATAVLLLLGDVAVGEDLQVQIICFNFETVQVTWNNTEHEKGTNLTFFYKYGEHQALTPCSTYIVQGGRTAGCRLEAQDTVLHFSVHRSAHTLLARQRWVAHYLKPRSPRDLRFLWGRDAVTVVCPDLPYSGLLYQVQHKTPFDTEWQSQGAQHCNVTVEPLDVEQCHSFRARVTPKVTYYGSRASPSDWSVVSHWQGGAPRDSCLATPVQPWTGWTRFLLVCSLVSLLTVALLLATLWKVQRVKRLLMPSVPDPKDSFPGLFEHHRGDFQEWIADTQDVAPWKKPPGGDQELPSEQPLEVRLARGDSELPASPSTQEEEDDDHEASPGSPRVPPRAPQAGELASLGSFTFVIADGAYMKL